MQYLPLLRRHNPSLPVVLVGCQGDNKMINMNNTVVDTNNDLDLETDNVVMHVETAAATSVKSVIVAFQVSGSTLGIKVIKILV